MFTSDSQIFQNLHVTARLRHELGVLSGRLAHMLDAEFPGDTGAVAECRTFLAAYSESHVVDQASEPADHDPLTRLCDALRLTQLERECVLFAGMADEHEAFAQVFRILHPDRQPLPTVALLTQVFRADDAGRDVLHRTLTTGAAVSSGLLRLLGDEPFFGRGLRLADGIWHVLHGIDAWPDRVRPLANSGSSNGLRSWLIGSAAHAVRAIANGSRCTVLVTDDDIQRAFDRATAIVEHAGVRGERFRFASEWNDELAELIQLHVLARHSVPIIQLRSNSGPAVVRLPEFFWATGPVVVCGQQGMVEIDSQRPLIGLTCDRLPPTDLLEMWEQAFPHLADQAEVLAAQFPLEPAVTRQVALDVQQACGLENREPTLDDIAASIRTRAGALLRGGIKLVRPAATWQQLVLPSDRKAQLREAVDRLAHQSQVLDRWGFLEGRHGARGVRMLFCGPPGTGKSLSAEVMAHTLRVDLLVVDLSQVVSKWIGETEKNLAEVFETAERSRAVLLFDEADALFGKRTEVSDAHDRYANLETAFLLARLERFEGLAILSTNLRQNIDPAFPRRLEFIVEYDQPDQQARLRLWQCHVPDGNLLDNDVDLSEFAKRYALVGGLIRNAAVAAAFLAAAENGMRPTKDRCQISRRHFVRAIKREYEKSGQPFPGLPSRMTHA